MENTLILGNVRCADFQRPRYYRFHHESVPDRDRLFLVRSGGIVVRACGRTVCATEGEFVYIAAGVESVTEYTGDVNRVMMFWFDRFCGCVEEPLCVYQPNPVAAALAEGCADADDATQYFLLSSLYGILHYLSQAEQRTSGVMSVVRYIEQHYAQEKKVSEYAAMAYMSESHFRKLFLAAVGKSPIAYRNEIRLQTARELILEGYSVSEAAEAVGFHSASFYCRLAAKQRRKGLPEDAIKDEEK